MLLDELLKKQKFTVIGLMSGTSMDGIDSALCSISVKEKRPEIELIHFITRPYPKKLKQFLLDSINGNPVTPQEISQHNAVIGGLFAETAIETAENVGIGIEKVDLIGSHGQTLWHQPKPEELYGKAVRSTLQIGESSVIRAKTGIVTVGDFRPADVALGGEGAPLIPYFDYKLFNSNEETRLLLNIGGISNITFLPKGGTIEDVRAFDTGPGNMVVDQLMQTLYRKQYDTDGIIALKGKVCEPMVDELLLHPFIVKFPPKSTGREDFGKTFTDDFLDKAKDYNLSRDAIIATASELTCRAIHYNATEFLPDYYPVNRIILSGGGIFNRFFLDGLERYFRDSEVDSIEAHGLHPEAKEAAAFAYFAVETVKGNPINLPAVTGARKRAVLGKICL